MRAETGSGPPTPACWASTCTVSRAQAAGPARGCECWAVSRGCGACPATSRPSPEAPRSLRRSLGRIAWNVAGGRPGAPEHRSGRLSSAEGGGREEAGLSGRCAVRRVARRLGWHGHQLPLPLPPRARGGRGRRLLQGAPLPVPVRARQGEAGPGAGGRPAAPQPPQHRLPPPRRPASCTAATGAT